VGIVSSGSKRKISATSVMISSVPNNAVPFNVSATVKTTYTVPNLDTTDSKLTLSCQDAGATAETVSVNRLFVKATK